LPHTGYACDLQSASFFQLHTSADRSAADLSSQHQQSADHTLHPLRTPRTDGMARGLRVASILSRICCYVVYSHQTSGRSCSAIFYIFSNTTYHDSKVRRHSKSRNNVMSSSSSSSSSSELLSSELSHYSMGRYNFYIDTVSIFPELGLSVLSINR